MTYGGVARAALGAALLTLLSSGLARAQAPARPFARKAALAARPHAEKAATVVSVDAAAVHLKTADGALLDAELRPSSLCLQDGLIVPPSQLNPGSPVLARTRTRASDGTVSLVLLCDPATAAVLDACRHHVLTGTVQSADERYLVVRPSAGGVPVTLRVTPKTLYRNSGANVPASAFPAGATVAVVCRGLPSGLLMAAVVSDRGADAVQERAILRPVVVSGTLAAVEPDRGLLVIAPRGKPRRTVAVGESTHVKVRKTEATLRDLTRGIHITARLGPGKDAAGHPLALSLSAYDAGPVRKR